MNEIQARAILRSLGFRVDNSYEMDRALDFAAVIVEAVGVLVGKEVE